MDKIPGLWLWRTGLCCCPCIQTLLDVCLFEVDSCLLKASVYLYLRWSYLSWLVLIFYQLVVVEVLLSSGLD